MQVATNKRETEFLAHVRLNHSKLARFSPISCFHVGKNSVSMPLPNKSGNLGYFKTDATDQLSAGAIQRMGSEREKMLTVGFNNLGDDAGSVFPIHASGWDEIDAVNRAFVLIADIPNQVQAQSQS